MTIPKRYKGIIYICISALCFAFMAAFVRLSGDLPTFQKTFFRNFVALFLAVGVLIKEKIPLRLESRRLLFPLTVRALAGTLGMIGNFYAIDRLVLSDASMLNKMSPFFAIVFSYLILKEKLTLFQLAAVITAFGGSLLIIKPSLSNVDLFPALAGFAGGMGAGLAYTCVHYLGQKGVKGPIIVSFFSGFSCLFCLPFLIVSYQHMSLMQLLCLLGAGVSAAGGQFSITAAYTHAPAREISIYDYSQLIFSTSLGFFLFGDVPDIWSFVGYAVIISMAVANFIYNNKRHGEGYIKRH